MLNIITTGLAERLIQTIGIMENDGYEVVTKKYGNFTIQTACRVITSADLAYCITLITYKSAHTEYSAHVMTDADSAETLADSLANCAAFVRVLTEIGNVDKLESALVIQHLNDYYTPVLNWFSGTLIDDIGTLDDNTSDFYDET